MVFGTHGITMMLFFTLQVLVVFSYHYVHFEADLDPATAWKLQSILEY